MSFVAARIRPAGRRVTAYEDKIYIDLGNRAWGAVEVTATGWRVLEHTPVKSRRAKGMRSLPEPVPGGSLDE